MPITALMPLVAALLGLVAGLVARSFARAPGWESFRSVAPPALWASVYCLGDLVLASPALEQHATFWSPVQHLAAGGLLYSLAGYLATVSGPRRLDRAIRAAGIAIGCTGVVAYVPGLVFERADHLRDVAWLDATYTEAQPTPVGMIILAASLLCLVLPIVRVELDFREGRPEAWRHALGFTFLTLTGAIDVATISLQLPLPFLFSLGFMGTLFVGAQAVFARWFAHAAALDARSRDLERTITERTQELALARDRLLETEKLAALGQLAAGVAHEVNNPAAAVVANLGYVLDAHARTGAFPTDAPSSLRESLTAMGRVTRIVRQLLDTGRAGARREVLAPVSLARAVESTLAIVRPLVPAHIEVDADVADTLAAQAREDLLVQSLVNLVTNAVQAIPEGRTGRITVRAEAVEGASDTSARVRLHVTDDGAGMSADIRRRMFEPFFTTKPPGIGTGLGLSVTLGLVRSMGGDVAIESEEGHGTRVTLELDAAEPVARVPSVAPGRSLPPATRLRVLLIDDERAVRAALERVLRRTYEVRTAGGVDEALAALDADADIDVILCDVLMADGGGERVYRTLTTRAPRLASRVIFMTGGAHDTARAFLAAQPQPVLEKPLDTTALASTVARLRTELAPSPRLSLAELARQLTPEA
jgi:signal transduction histidine kinase/CheY-like chemotaxis protein